MRVCTRALKFWGLATVRSDGMPTAFTERHIDVKVKVFSSSSFYIPLCRYSLLCCAYGIQCRNDLRDLTVQQYISETNDHVCGMSD